MKKVVILGSAGSIGESTLSVIEALSSCFQVTGLAVHRNYKRVLQQAERFNVRHVAVADTEMAGLCAKESPAGIEVHEGQTGMAELAALDDTDIVVCAVVGIAGLRPVMAAVDKGTDIALATKEVLVAAGQIVTEACAKHGSLLLPVDSEHSAVFQCLQTMPNAPDLFESRGRMPSGDNRQQPAGDSSDQQSAIRNPQSAIKRIILTASGGPFTSQPNIDLDKVTVNEVLAHPRWNMGKKVTVDSATLMNKGLEIMEAHWLFGVPVKNIDVVVHPESIVHSMVEFVDCTVIAQLSVPDMRFAIQYALTYPERVDGKLPELDLTKTGTLHFEEPDEKRFPCLTLAREAASRDGTMPAVLNAANEIAVQKFLEGKIAFSGIWRLVESVMEKHEVIHKPGLDDVIEADNWARRAFTAP